MRIYSLCLAATFALAGATSCAAATPPQDPASIPIAAFFTTPQFTGAVLSPDGANLALLVRGPEGNIVLAVKPTAGGAARIIAGIVGFDLDDVHWVNNRRMVFSALRKQADASERSGGPGLHAINLDGSKRVQLVAHEWGAQKDGRALPPNTHFLGTVHDDASNDIYVTRSEAFKEDFEGYTVLRMDTETANLKHVDTPRDIRGVIVDTSGVPRVATAGKNGRQQILYNDPALGTWRVIADEANLSTELMTPVLVTSSGDLYVLTQHGHDMRALYRFDIASGKLDAEPIIALKNYDFEGHLLMARDHRTVLGVRYETSETITTWFDEGMKQAQARVDAALPSTINLLSLPRDGSADNVLVHSYSDTEPGFVQLFQRATGTFTKLGTRLPAINPLQMASMKMVHYKARDGRDIPAYLTLPKDAPAKPPMVVLVHGGPWTRGGHLKWNAEVQFLASRGYAVLQPEYRGSTGFGYEHFHAGWRQWGKAMQDDVADGTSWAIAQGYADPARICIAGASYGGYATLMGLVNNPELFRCGIEWVGVTDINLLYEGRFTNTSQEAMRFTLPALVGDQSADAAMLKAESPLENAARITQPLLLAYGGKDRTVPIKHGEKLYAIVKKTNPNVEWVEYPDEGHGWFFDRTQLDFWGRVERFLAKNNAKP